MDGSLEIIFILAKHREPIQQQASLPILDHFHQLGNNLQV
jgi:hypothetical protein